MTRKEKIYNALVLLSENITIEKIKKGFKGYEAEEIAEMTNIDRSNVSRELNCLIKEGKIIKITGRPVYFMDRHIVEDLFNKNFSANTIFSSYDDFMNVISNKDNNKDSKDPFSNMIGSKGSLELAIKQAKAAVLYPPKGLHTLITGPTGVGKTTFAEMMYKYALSVRKIKEDAQLVVFNCAEYAENPQLVLSQLFGHVKGAFTGAEKDKEGLIERAKGGIILLDEVHRLTPEGQEMLFILMDKNKYRRLGETETFREANVLIIGATTEDINSALLKTFLRRIPMLINLPSLSQRPISERYELIKCFFKEEVRNVQVPIKVYKNVMEALLLYDCHGNIGQLKADIQLLCARGFLEYKTFGKNEIEIDTPILPDYIYNGFLNGEKRRNEIVNLMEFGADNFSIFTDYEKEKFALIDNYQISDNLYQRLAEKYNKYLEDGYSLEDVNKILSSEVEEYLKNLLNKSDTEKGIPDKEELFKIVSPRVYNAVKDAASVAEQKLNKKIKDNIIIGLALHFSALIEKIQNGNLDYSEDVEQITLNNPQEFKIAKIMTKIVGEELNINIPFQEAGFLTMFLATLSQSSGSRKKIGCIVLSHGDSTATSIAKVVNELLGVNVCRAIDMPLDAKVKDILGKTAEMVRNIDEGKGVVLLVDMGSLTAFSEIITQKTGINTYSFEMVSTPLALEVVRKCMTPDMTLKKLIKEMDSVCPYIGRNVVDNIVEELNAQQEVVITVCISGKGCAIKIANLIENNMPIIKDKKIELIPIGMSEFNECVRELNNKSKRILAIVGSLNPEAGIPFIPVDEIIVGEGLEKLNKIVLEDKHSENKNIQTYYSDGEKVVIENEKDIYIKILERTLTFLNPVKAYDIVKQTFDYIIDKQNIEADDSMKIGYIIHCSCMIERLLIDSPLVYKNVRKLIQKERKDYEIIKQSMKIIEQYFGLIIPDTEIGYIIDLFDTHKKTLA